jgi:hypothetical protein
VSQGKRVKKKNQIIVGVIMFGFMMLAFSIAYHEFVYYSSIPLSQDEINQLKNTKKAVIIYPYFTQVAYGNNDGKSEGFYDYYKGDCSEKCLTQKFNPFDLNPSYNTGKASYTYLLQLGYPAMTDMWIDQSPDSLDQYDKVIVLHEEYATEKVFNAITNHKNVIYLYPNSFYGKISLDFKNKTISLLNGHGYPNKNITNGFGWKWDNTHPDEQNIKCQDWAFRNVTNGIQINCYPELLIQHDRHLLEVIRDYP